MRVLIATPYLPWPLTEGGRVAQYRTIEALRGSCEFTLVVPVHNTAQQAHAREFADRFPEVTVDAVPCFRQAPPPSRKALVRKKGADLLRNILTSPATEPPRKPAEPSPYYPFTPLSRHFIEAVDRKLSEGCDIFQAEFADMMSLGPFAAGRVPSLFVHHQLHFVYVRRFLEAHAPVGANARYLRDRMLGEEAFYLNAFDAAVVFSEVDRKALNEFCPVLPADVSPFPSPENPSTAARTFAQPVTEYVMVASEGNGPNVQGLHWFMKEVWPRIKEKQPAASIEVIGQWSPAEQARTPHSGDIRFTGYVPELSGALQGRIMIVPVWVGSGIRTKILSAWSACCPVVTTTIGVEGLPGRPGDHYMVADDAAAFAAICIDLSADTGKLTRLAANGLELVKEHYSLEAVRKTRMEVYQKLLSGRRMT